MTRRTMQQVMACCMWLCGAYVGYGLGSAHLTVWVPAVSISVVGVFACLILALAAQLANTFRQLLNSYWRVQYGEDLPGGDQGDV